MNCYMNCYQVYEGRGVWHQGDVFNRVAQIKLDLIVRVNGDQFEMIAWPHGHREQQRRAFGTLGTGPLWTIPQMYSSDGAPTRFMLEYKFVQNQKELINGAISDLVLPFYQCMTFKLILKKSYRGSEIFPCLEYSTCNAVGPVSVQVGDGTWVHSTLYELS